MYCKENKKRTTNNKKRRKVSYRDQAKDDERDEVMFVDIKNNKKF
jgi:hypothetical protein